MLEAMKDGLEVVSWERISGFHGVHDGMIGGRARDMKVFRGWVTVFVMAAGVAAMAQSPAPPSTQRNAAADGTRSTELVVKGHDGHAPLIYRDGRAYVEVEGLARITGATLGFQGSRMVLTLPAVAAFSAAPAPAPPEEKGFTREFLRAGVEEMSVIREWRSAIENAIRTNNPVEQSWVAGYRRNAEDRMAMATASATTDSDRQALPLLQNALSMVQQLSDRFLALRSTLTNVRTDALDNDPLDQKILACAQGMAAVAIPGAQFQDVEACH